MPRFGRRARRAAVSPRAGSGRAPTSGYTSWQEQVRDLDRGRGPAFVGRVLDDKRLLAGLVPCRLETVVRGEWVPVASPPAIIGVRRVAGYGTDFASLVADLVRAHQSVGEAWLFDGTYAEDQSGGRVDWGWQVGLAPAVATVGATVRWTDPSGVTRSLDPTMVHRSWVPDPYQPSAPFSPLARALSDIETLSNILWVDRVGSDSALLTNRVVRVVPTGSDGTVWSPDQIDAAITAWEDKSNEALRREPGTGRRPLMASMPELEPVDLGPQFDAGVGPAAERALAMVARGMAWPQRWLLDGIGEERFANFASTLAHNLGLYVAPSMRQAVADLVRVAVMPEWRILADKELLVGRIGGGDVIQLDPAKLRLTPDVDVLVREPNRTADLLAGYDTGAVTLAELRGGLGLTPDMRLPSGVDEWDWWKITHESIAASTTGDVITPEKPAEAVTAALPAPAELGVEAGRAVAAADDTTRDVLERLSGEDRATFAAIATAIGVLLNTIAARAAAEVVRSLPRGSDLRSAYREMPAGHVVAAAVADAELTGWSEESVTGLLAGLAASAPGSVDVIAAGVEQVMTLDSIHTTRTDAVWVDAGVAPPPAMSPTGAAIRNVILWVAARALLSGWDSTTQTGPVPPNAVLMIFTPSAGPDAVGWLQRRRRNLGLAEVAVVNEWVHSYWGTPATPFDPHLALNGQRTGADETSLAGWFPQDHPNCRCALVPKVV